MVWLMIIETILDMIENVIVAIIMNKSNTFDTVAK